MLLNVVQNIVEGDVIENVSEPTDCIVAAGFLKKTNSDVKMETDKPPAEDEASGIGKASKTIPDPSLVVDFLPLNKYVKRLVHPFPKCFDVINKISSDSKSFIKLDALHGYFQIPMDKESYRLITFLQPSDRYKFKHELMGLNASSDEFCQRTDEAN